MGYTLGGRAIGHLKDLESRLRAGSFGDRPEGTWLSSRQVSAAVSTIRCRHIQTNNVR